MWTESCINECFIIKRKYFRTDTIMYPKEFKVTSCFLCLIKQHLHLLSVIYNLQTISNILEMKWLWPLITEWYLSVSADLHWQGSLWRFLFLVNRKFGFVFDHDIADIRWFGIVIFKDPSFLVNKPDGFCKNRSAMRTCVGFHSNLIRFE